jgi:hypothetical protein
MTTALKNFGVHFEENNPTSGLMDPETGSFPDEVLNQRVLSAIIEVRLNIDETDEVLPVIMKVSHEIDTVFSLSVVGRFNADGELPIMEKLTKLGINLAPNAKINLGMGRPLSKD